MPKLTITLPRPLAFSLLAMGLALLPFLVDVGLGRSWVRLLDLALLYVILSLGLNIVVGYAGLLDLGYVAFYALGAYVYAWLASPHFGLHLPFWVILPLGAALAGMFGVLLGTPTLRLRGDYLAIVTLGFGEIIRIFLNNLNAPVNITNGPQGINLIDPVRLGSFSLSRPHELFGITFTGVHLTYYLFLLFTLMVIFISMRLEDSRTGRAWVAIREDEIAAAATGINTRNLKLLAFAMGATFGGLAGGLFASFQGFISPESFNLMESIMILCMIVLGGMGHIPGVIFGAVVLTLLPEALRYTGDWQNDVFGQIYIDPADLRMLLFGLALVAVMLYRPAGLLPATRRRREFADDDRAGEPVPYQGRDGFGGHRLRQKLGDLLSGMPDAESTPLLTVSGVSKAFGGLHALSDISLQVQEGEIFGLIGPNGAGKTTLFNALTGLYSTDRGEIRLSGSRLDGRKPHQVLRAGLARTFQNIRLFAEMTALENVLVGRHARTRSGVVGAVLRLSGTRREEADSREHAYALLQRVGIAQHAHRMAKNLSYGDQRRLEIARALATEPKLLALDEPAAGMNPAERAALRELLLQLQADGLTLLLIEHDVKLVMGLCTRLAVLDYGVKIAEGTPDVVSRDPKVIAAYLGGEIV